MICVNLGSSAVRSFLLVPILCPFAVSLRFGAGEPRCAIPLQPTAPPPYLTSHRRRYFRDRIPYEIQP
jgi:hypothetical protein